MNVEIYMIKYIKRITPFCYPHLYIIKKTYVNPVPLYRVYPLYELNESGTSVSSGYFRFKIL